MVIALHLPILSILVGLPVFGSFLLLFLRGTGISQAATARGIALGVSLITFLLSLVLWIEFDPSVTGLQFEERANWMPGFGVSYHLGVDGFSLLLLLLTTLLTPISILAAWRVIHERVSHYMLAVLMLQAAMIGVFVAQDFVVFYISYEATLVPGSLLIGLWGGPRRAFAAMKFFLLTFGSSLLMLLVLLYAWYVTGSTDMDVLLHTRFPMTAQSLIFLAFVLAFGTKLPIWPLHSWLPDAYGEAPAPATALLSGVMAKAGAYGLLRFAIGMAPDAARHYAPVMMILGVVGVIYAAIIACAQTDMKKMVAYSSFSHMGLVVVGLFSLTTEGIDGALFQMVSHGIIIAGLFFCVSMVSFRAGSRDFVKVTGVVNYAPRLAALAMAFSMASIGLPGTGGFVGEVLVIFGALHVNFWLALLAGTSMVLGAIYMLSFYWRVMFGKLSGVVAVLHDMTRLEMAVLVPLAVLTLWMGFYPTSFTRVFNASAHAQVVAVNAHDHALASAALPVVISRN
ncbi:NADH-quinone oxidoreductase chain M [Granulibacter bethesdensis]|uniref:NADH-quinone oxidoreductase chain M n=1 Tax=Granulibacter bethesdensis TaxID=364410 RepID=A0AAC9P8G6_9PROT|nr:NADH-quinone oxidoreductase chain M [Granulibacter bethesdensis]APH61539.1 NADH-quinone oxidoreductase chain M [Granulibacter bethesdensis]